MINFRKKKKNRLFYNFYLSVENLNRSNQLLVK